MCRKSADSVHSVEGSLRSSPPGIPRWKPLSQPRLPSHPRLLLSPGCWENSVPCGGRFESLEVPRAAHCPLSVGLAAASSGPTVDDLAEKAPKDGRAVPESLLRITESFHLCHVSEPHTLSGHRPGKDLGGHLWGNTTFGKCLHRIRMGGGRGLRSLSHTTAGRSCSLLSPPPYYTTKSHSGMPDCLILKILHISPAPVPSPQALTHRDDISILCPSWAPRDGAREAGCHRDLKGSQ